jgi:hypothetical protein
LEGLSAFWMFEERQRAKFREHERWHIREKMAEENAHLHGVVSEQKQEIERLKAENKLLHQRGFKPSKPKPTRPEEAAGEQRAALPPKPRGAPKGHPPWSRKVPERIERHIHVEAPLICPHCQNATDATIGGQTSYIQEDKSVLGDKLDGLLVTDAYAAYNAIECAGGRQSCLAHLLRKSKEIGEELALIDGADAPSVRFCQSLGSLFKEACAAVVPKPMRARRKLADRFREKLAPICRKPLAFEKAETLRKRLIPTSREYKCVCPVLIPACMPPPHAFH